jgi:hypothetical protein
VELHGHVPKIGKTPAHWLLEGLFILVSVGLAFGVAEFREHRANHELTARVLKSLQSEVEHNVAILEPENAAHRKWVDALAKADSSKSGQTGLEVFFATRPDLPADFKTAFPPLRRGAWDAALSTGALRLIDYDLVAALSDIYQMQEMVSGAVRAMSTGGLSSTAAFDPSSQVVSVRQLWLAMTEIEGTERLLLDLYRQHLPAIRAASNAEP